MRVKDRVGRLLGLVALPWIIGGCAEEGLDAVGASSAAVPVVEVPRSPVQGVEGGGTGTQLYHELGLVHPGQEVRHRFPIANRTSRPWTFREFQTDCACTIGKASAPVVEPSTTEFVEVVYKAPAINRDESRTVRVRFAEDQAPLISLVIGAKVRPEVSVEPRRISFERVGRGRRVETHLEVRNYLDRDIRLVSATPSASWLTITGRSEYRGGPLPTPRQVWRLRVEADTRPLGPGKHHAEVSLRFNMGMAPQSVGVDIALTAPVQAIPDRLFFGRVTRGQASTNKMLLQVSSEVALPTRESMSLNHDLGDQLSLRLARATSNYWEVAATLVPGASAPSMLNGAIEIRFNEGGLPPIRIPVLARIEDR